MKKVFLAVLFMGAFVTANAVELDVRKDCHAYACKQVGIYEGEYGDQLSFDDYEWIYETFSNICEN